MSWLSSPGFSTRPACTPPLAREASTPIRREAMTSGRERERERERPSSQPKLTGSGKCTHGAMAVGGICSDWVMAAANPRGESPSPRRDLRLPHAVCTPAARSGATGPSTLPPLRPRGPAARPPRPPRPRRPPR